MNHETFEKLSGNTVRECLEMLNTKSKEYSRSGEKLHNFKRAGAILNQIPEKALIGMMIKQFTSILDITTDIEQNRLPKLELYREKMKDTINYLLLLEGLISERIETKKTEESSINN